MGDQQQVKEISFTLDGVQHTVRVRPYIDEVNLAIVASSAYRHMQEYFGAQLWIALPLIKAMCIIEAFTDYQHISSCSITDLMYNSDFYQGVLSAIHPNALDDVLHSIDLIATDMRSRSAADVFFDRATTMVNNLNEILSDPGNMKLARRIMKKLAEMKLDERAIVDAIVKLGNQSGGSE